MASEDQGPVLGNIEHPERISLTPCPECGRPELRDEDRDQFCDGTDCRMTGREQVPYVPASELQGAVALSDGAAAFLLGTVRHLNQAKILPADNAQALQTSAWLEEIEAALMRRGGAVRP